MIGCSLYSKPFPASYDVLKIITLSNLFQYVLADFYPLEQRLGWTKMQFSSLINLIRIRNKFNIKLVVMHQQCFPLLCLLSRLLGCKVLIYVGGSPFYPNENEPKTKNRLSRIVALIGNLSLHICFLFSSFLVVPSKELIKSFNIEKYAWKTLAAPTRIINIKTFKQTTQSKDRNRQIAYIGRLSQEKGIDIVIKTFLKLAKMDPELKFIIIGDGPLMNSVKYEVSKSNFDERIKIAGWLKPKDIVVSLNKVKLILVPSRSEGLPSVLLESMACGTPAMVSFAGVMKYVVQDNYNGFHLNSADPDNIARTICLILKEEENLQDISKRAHEYVATRYSEEAVLKVWLPILRRLRN